MLAIIIPYFKIDFIDDTLNSLSNQTDNRFKVYIGDDASPEDPSILLSKYHGKFEFKYHRFKENLGEISLPQHWKRCIDLTNNEHWIMILGDDDFISDTVVESWYSNYNLFSEKSNLIRFATKTILEESGSMSDIYTHPIWENATDSFYRKFINETRSSLSEYIFSRKSYEKYGFYEYPLAWNSDDRAWLDFSDGKPIFSINDSIVFFRVSAYNISGKKDNFKKKNESSKKFFEFIVFNKLKFYNKSQRHKLLMKYEKSIKKIRTLKLYDWGVLMFFCLRYFDMYSLRKVFKRFLKSVIK